MKISAILPNLLQDVDTDQVNQLRDQVATALGVDVPTLQTHAEAFRALVRQLMGERRGLLEEIGQETAKVQSVYLCTVSRLLPHTEAAGNWRDIRRGLGVRGPKSCNRLAMPLGSAPSLLPLFGTPLRTRLLWAKEATPALRKPRSSNWQFFENRTKTRRRISMSRFC